MFRTKLFKFVDKNFEILELFLVLLFVVAAIMLINEIKYALQCLHISLILFAVLYMLMALRPFENQVAGLRIVARRVIYVSFMLSCLSALSTFQFDGNIDTRYMLIASLVFLILAMITLLLLKFVMKVKSGIFSNILRCSVFILVIGWMLLMF